MACKELRLKRCFIGRLGNFAFSSLFLISVPAVNAANKCGVLDNASLSYASLKSLIQNPDCGILTVSDVLAKLPEEFTQRYMLFYRSRSLQGPHEIDYVNPRALVYTAESKVPFIL